MEKFMQLEVMEVAPQIMEEATNKMGIIIMPRVKVLIV